MITTYIGDLDNFFDNRLPIFSTSYVMIFMHKLMYICRCFESTTPFFRRFSHSMYSLEAHRGEQNGHYLWVGGG
jgi:hypothetical protein